MVYPIGKNLFKTLVPIDDQTVILVYSIPVKSLKLKGLQGRQSSAVFGVFINFMGVDFLHRRISAAHPKYPP